MSRDTMVYYRSFRESLRELPPDLYKVVSETIFDYAFEGIAPGPDSNAVAKALFIAIKPVIDNAHNRYDACVENGRKGGAPKGSRNNPSGKAIQPNQRPNQRPNQYPNLYKDKDVDKDKDIESKGDFKGEPVTAVSPDAVAPSSADKPRKVAAKRAAFVAPSPQEVKDYISEKGYAVDAQRFIDFYEAKGWMIGRNKMKDWRAAVRTWTRRPDQTPNQTNHETRKTNFL